MQDKEKCDEHVNEEDQKDKEKPDPGPLEETSDPGVPDNPGRGSGSGGGGG